MIQLQKSLILASSSPRRHQLLTQMGFEFAVEVRPTDESFPATMPPIEIPAYLAKNKAAQFEIDVADNLILCADTVVVADNIVLNKPATKEEAYQMLRKLSGRSHEVITGVCLLSKEGYQTQTDVAKVYFKNLTDKEIRYYIQHYKPFDKAGAYGVQEWIGMIGIEKIEGSFYTIMGFPLHKVYQLLTPYIVA